MKITSLQLRNFLSYGEDTQEITFNNGNNFIVGPNGSGKTNVVRAIKLVGLCLEKNSVDLGKYDPDINLNIELELSKFEQELLGSILCVSIYREIEEMEESNRFNDFKDMFIREIIFDIDDNEINNLYELNKNILNLKLPETKQTPVQKIQEKRNQLFSKLDKNNFEKFKETLEKSYFTFKLGFLKGNRLLEFKRILLSNDMHSNIGQLFKKIKVNLKADVTRLIPSISVFQKSRCYLIDYDGLSNEKNSDVNLSLLKAMHIFLRKDDAKISPNVVNKMLESTFDADISYKITLPNLNLKYGKGEIKNLSYEVFQKIKAFYPIENEGSHIIFCNIIKKLFKNRTIIIPEHRGLIAEDYSGISYFTINQLSETLYRWKNSSTQNERKRFYDLKKEFENLFKMKFDVYVKEEPIRVTENYPKLIIGDVIRTTSTTGYNEDIQKNVKWADIEENVIERAPLIQFTDSMNVPIEMHEAPSGAYETLMILTSLFERGDKTIIIDEPARALHPQLQRKVINTISNYLNEEIIPTYILITHSPYFINDFLRTQIWKCVYGKLIRFNISEIDDKEEESKRKSSEGKASKFLKRIDSVNKLLFSNKIMIVEGPNDKLFVEELGTNFPENFKLESNGWDIIELHGIRNLPIVWKLIKKLEVEALIVVDLDAAFPTANKTKGDTKKKYLPFKDSVLGKMLNEFKEQEELSKFLDKNREDVLANEQILNDFTKLLLEDNIFIWKLGSLEEVLEEIAGEKIRLKSTSSEMIYRLVERIGTDFSEFEVLNDLANLL